MFNIIYACSSWNERKILFLAFHLESFASVKEFVVFLSTNDIPLS